MGKYSQTDSIARSVARANEFNRNSPVISSRGLDFELIYDKDKLKEAVDKEFARKHYGNGKVKHPNRKKRNIEKKLRQKQRKKLGTTGKYSDYMKSKEWKLRREKFISLKKHRNCEICCSESNLIVHHHTYLRVGCELDQDLALLCNSCHTRLHFAADGTKYRLKEKILRKRYAEILAQEFIVTSLVQA